jgi:hypothetical protein
MGCNCKNNKKPIKEQIIEQLGQLTETPKELTEEEIEGFNNIDVINPLSDDEE